MNIKNIQGLKYPDEYFIKWFFKYGLQNINNNLYLELGCSNGCNLMLPYQFNNNVIGVDLNSTLINYATNNFKLLNLNDKYQFYNDDMIEFCKTNHNINANALILANSIYYIPKNEFIDLLNNVVNNNLIKNNIPFFIRFRLPNDFRNHKGTQIEENSIIMQNGITGEDGAFCKFYEEDEMITLLQDKLKLRDFQTMSILYENIQNNTKVKNSEIVIWGTIN